MPSNVIATKPPPLIPLVGALLGLIIAFHLGAAVLGRPLFTERYLGTALEYARGPINLLHPVIVGFNATGTPTAQELPLWQAAAGLVFKLTGSTWYGLANVVSLAFFMTCLWPFFQLARQYVGERAAWWALAFFLAQPLTVMMAGAADLDGLCLVVSVWFLFFVDRMVRTGRAWWCVPTTLFAVLSAVLKLPLFMAACLCSIALLLVNARRDRRSWVLLAGALAGAAGARAVWWDHTNALAAQAVYPYVELRSWQTHSLVARNFGDLSYLMSPGHWLSGGWRCLHATLGTLPLVGLLAAALLRPEHRLAKLWLLATVLASLAFAHLVLDHWHYYLMFCPPVALLCGATLARWEGFWAREISAPRLQLALAGAVLVLSTLDGLNALKVVGEYDPFPESVSRLVRQSTQSADRLIVYSSDPVWGGEVLFRSDRQGLYVSSSAPAPRSLYDLLNNAEDLHRLKALGYNKLVLISQSPLQYALAAAKPGSQLPRALYPAAISKSVDAWPVVYRSEDVMIREIR